MPVGFISVGSNIQKEKYIPASLKALQAEFGQLMISSIYESDPIGFSGDPFHNLIVGFESKRDVKEITDVLREIEIANGRVRDCKKFSARTLDLDLVLLGDLVMHEGRIQIPRDEIERYAFVLEPLAEIAGDLHHPVNGVSYTELWRDFDKTNLAQHKIKTPQYVSELALS